MEAGEDGATAPHITAGGLACVPSVRVRWGEEAETHPCPSCLAPAGGQESPPSDDPPGCYLPILISPETSPSLPPWSGSHKHLVGPGISLPEGDLASRVADSLDADPGFCTHSSDKPLPVWRLSFPVIQTW